MSIGVTYARPYAAVLDVKRSTAEHLAGLKTPEPWRNVQVNTPPGRPDGRPIRMTAPSERSHNVIIHYW